MQRPDAYGHPALAVSNCWHVVDVWQAGGRYFDLVIIVIRFVARRRIYDGRFLVAHDQVMSAGRIGIPFCYAVYLLDPFFLPA